VPESKRHPARRPQKRPTKPGHRNPAAAAAPAAPRSPWRRTLERWSAGPLLLLHRTPTWLLPVVLAVLLLVGLAAPFAWAGVFLLVVGAFLGWLLLISWPVTSGSGRMLRLVAVVAVFGAAFARLTGRF
jgi:hypothetical protein